MMLIGQYDSPSVRRVGVALRLYGLAFLHQPWSVFGDAASIARYNPLIRVPTLVLDDGSALMESAAILDALDGLAPAERRLIPDADRPEARRAVLRCCALATGIADKAVALVYERALHVERSAQWEQRCRSQIQATLGMLEAERAAGAGPWWSGEALTHADIAVACGLRFLGEAHPTLFLAADWPALAAHCARAEALPALREICQPFRAPAGA